MVHTFEEFKVIMNKKPAFRKKTAAQKKALYEQYRAVNAKKKPATKKSGAPKSKAVGTALGTAAGAFLPGPFKALAPLAGTVGGLLGEGIGTIFGLGEYRVKQNSIINEGQTPPMMHSTNDTVVVRHRGYLGDVYSSAVAGDFKVSNYPIQPGVPAFMPWQSQLAECFQEWIPLGIVCEFKSNTGMVSSASTPQIGMVIMATDYDSYYSDPFKNKVDMENTVYTTSSKATESFYHPIECAPSRNVFDRLFIRHGTVPDGQPPQLYDLGTFAIGSVGCPTANQNLGELWVTSEIAYSKATMRNFQSQVVDTDYFAVQSNAGLVGTDLWGSATAAADNSIGGSVSAPSADESRYTFPPTLSAGTYEWTCYVQVTVSDAVTVAPTFTYNACVKDGEAMESRTLGPVPAWAGTEVLAAPSLAVSSILHSMTGRVRITGEGAWFNIDMAGTGLANGLFGCNLLVKKINSNVSNWVEPERRLRQLPTSRAVAPEVSTQADMIRRIRQLSQPEKRSTTEVVVVRENKEVAAIPVDTPTPGESLEDVLRAATRACADDPTVEKLEALLALQKALGQSAGGTDMKTPCGETEATRL